MADFSLSFGEMEACLASVHDIASDKRTQFQARLRKFFRLDGTTFSSRREKAPGRAASFDVSDLLGLEILLELTQLGLGPERAIKISTRYRQIFNLSLAMAANDALHSVDIPTILHFDPNNLEELTSASTEERRYSPGPHLFRARPDAETLGILLGKPRTSVVNVSRCLEAIEGVLSKRIAAADLLQEAFLKSWNAVLDDEARFFRNALRRKLAGPNVPTLSPLSALVEEIEGSEMVGDRLQVPMPDEHVLIIVDHSTKDRDELTDAIKNLVLKSNSDEDAIDGRIWQVLVLASPSEDAANHWHVTLPHGYAILDARVLGLIPAEVSAACDRWVGLRTMLDKPLSGGSDGDR